jgi:DNA repair exonuclease SbcCD ATPase subunit
MTKKRFTVPENYRCIQDNLTKEHYLCEDKTEAINLTYLLNELADENQYLKSLKWNQDCINEISISMQQIQLLKKENEQLKQRNKRFEEKIQRERNSFTKTHERWSKEAETKIKELSEENEQLKQFIQELTTKGTGRIDLADGYSYSVSAILTNWKGDVE